MNLKKGIYLSLMTAIISGFSIFLNATYVNKLIKDAFISTSVRNILVALLLSSVLIGICKWVKLKNLTLKQWGQLVLIGLIGGSIPFLLFFKGLSISQAAALNGAFIHKTLFLWVAMLALIFLKEKLSFWQIGAFGVMLAGTYLAGGPKSWSIGPGEKMVLLAVIMWAVEFIIAKKVLEKLPGVVVAWGRMFFGSLFLIGFLLWTGRIGSAAALNSNQWWWLIGTGLLLFGYVTTWYNGLKYAPATVVTSILTLGFPVTAILNLIFISHKFELKQVIGLALITLAVIVILKNAQKLKLAGIQEPQYVRS